ncbi:MAG: LamG-like jellyroll fold domain-containing protein, partial [Candidatus Odinarchaeota archaeon]
MFVVEVQWLELEVSQMRRAYVALLVILVFLVTIVGEPLSNDVDFVFEESLSTSNNYSLSDWNNPNTGTGTPLSGTILGSKSSYGTAVVDRTRAGYIGTDSPLGWSSEYLEGELDHLSYWVDSGLVNPTLNAEHEEHWFFSGSDSQYNYDPFYVPDGWTIVKFDSSDGTQHPQHGTFEMNRYSGNGYDGSIGWRFDANPDSGTTFEPTNMMYFSQQISKPWRSVYSAEITFRYYVSSTSILDDDVYIFTRLENYTSKHHVFVSGTPMDTWFQGTATVPSSYLQSLDYLDSLLFDIGLGTDISGQPGSSVHEVYLDDVELRLLVRPFPEEIDLRANGAFVTGSTRGSVSPYVPDGANRDCYSGIESNGGSGGVDLNGYSNNGVLEVGADVPLYPDWTTATAYQVGLQFPLYIPRSAAIESAFLEVEAFSSSIGNPGMRIYVANEDNVAAFTSGYPLLPDRYDWVNTSIYWLPTTWLANGRYTTPDISALIQDVVSRSGWQSGNYICIMIDYAYSNQQYAYDQIKGSTGFAQADLARLFVDFIEVESGDTIPSFQFNKKIIIDHTRVESDLQDFPVLVDIWDKDLHFNTQPDGDDIAFMFKNQIIPHEIELFDKKGNGTHAHLVCWVKVPYLSSFTDTTLTMVYGDNDLGSQEDPENVWDNDFSTVWHLNDNPSQPQWDSTNSDYLPHQPQILDSTSPMSDGTTYGTMTSTDSVSGIIGNGIDLEGVNDYIDFGNVAEVQMSGAFTVEAWFNAGFIDNDYLVVKSGESGYRGWDISFDDDPSISPAGWVMFRYSSDGVNTDIAGYERVNPGQWYHVVGVFYPSVFARFYLNGKLVEEVTSGIPTSVNDPNRPLRLGRRSDNLGGTSYLDAIVDEVRISNVARSDAWIKTQYNNQRNPELFLTISEQAINFRYMKDIVIDHNKVASNLTGFPVLIDIYDSDLHTNVQPDGDDIMFAWNGRSLPHEIELFDQQYNATHAHLIAWVRTDLSSTFDTIVTMYYANPTMGSQENPLEVWRNQYQGVWHLGNDPSGALPAPQVTDSTYNGNDGTTYGSMTQSDRVIGHIGNALDFDGSNDYVDCGDTSSLTVGYNDFAMSLWFATTDLDIPLAIKGAIGTNAYRYMLSVTSSGTVKAEIDDNSVTPGKITIYSASTLNNGLWHHAVMVRSGSWFHLYIDGAEVPTSPVNITGYGSVNSVEPFLIAACDNYDNAGAPNLFARAQLDEVRVLNDPITSQWILTEYNNQFDSSGFYSLGIEQEAIVPKEVPLDFMYRKDISIDHTKVTSDLNGFPVLIELYDKDLRFDVQADGDDIVFVRDGWILPHEIELFEQIYNSSHAHLIAWVRLDLSSSADTVFSMYYGDSSSASYENPSGVWDTSYAAVWHLSEDPSGTIYDSTANNNHGMGLPIGSEPSLQSGKIYRCSEFNGEATNERIETPHSSSLSLQSDILVEVWIRTNNTDPTSDTIIAKWGDVGHRNYWLGKLDSSTLAFYVDNTQSVTASFSLVNDGSWHHVVGVANSISGNLLLYIDGIERGNALYSGSTQTGTSVLQIGNNPGSTGFIQEWDGQIDEVRVSGAYRSSGWISTEFNNQYNPSTFYLMSMETLNQPTEFAHKKDIVVDHTKVDTDLIDFPMLVDIFDTDLRTDVQADGDDIIFKSGYYLCPHEIVSFDQAYNETHAHLIAWVKADLSASFNTIITMYYGNPNLMSQENPSAVWGDYVGVWHLDDSPTGIVYDSSQYNNDGTTLGSMTGSDLVPGQVGSGFELDGADDMVNVSESSSLDSIKYAGTLSIWINWVDASDSGYQRIMTTSDRFILNPSPPPTLIQDDGFEWAVQPDGDNYFYPWGGNSIDYNLATNPFTDNIWHHVVVTLDYNTKSVKMYLDGIPMILAIENVPTQWTQLASLGDWLWGGNQLDAAGQHFLGKFDEIRVSNAVRPSGWISTEYNNQYNPSSFYSIGVEEQISGEGYTFTTSSESSITVGAELSLGVKTPIQSYTDDFTLGSSFSIVNGSLPIWTAGVLVSPLSEFDAVSFEITYPDGEWWPFSVTNPSGIEMTYAANWTCFDGKLVVGSTAVDEYGMWHIKFLDRNHVLDTQMGPVGGPYTTTNQFAIGDDIQFRVWSSGTIGST